MTVEATVTPAADPNATAAQATGQPGSASDRAAIDGILNAGNKADIPNPPDKTAEEAAAAAKAEETPLTDEQFKEQARAALGIKSKEPETVEHWRSRFGGLTKAHNDTVQRLKAREAMLESLNVKVIETKDGLKLVANDKYVAKASQDMVGEVFKDLDDKTKELAAEAPEKFTKAVIAKVLEKVTPNIGPTANKGDIEISDARKTLITAELSTAKDAAGNAEHPDFDELAPFIAELADSDKVPTEFKKAMLADEDSYRFALKLFYDSARAKLAPIFARQKAAQAKLDAKKKLASEEAILGDAGTRRGATGGGTDPEKAAIDAILKAK